MQRILSRKKLCFIPLFLLPLLFFLFRTSPQPSTDQQFEEQINLWFAEDVCANPLHLHYTLAHPKSLGIETEDLSLSATNYSIDYEERLNRLHSYPTEELSTKHQLTQKILTLSYETEASAFDYRLLEEVLNPSLGIQAQLPILLAEYTLRSEEDVQNYLRLLASVYAYFENILAFEQEKAAQGTFMSDTTADRIIEQCSYFIENPEENYLDSVFQSNLSAVKELTREKREGYQALHARLIQTEILPAYRMLIEGLECLKGSGQNTNGLFYLPDGTAYYEYLLQSNCGLYESVEEIQTRLLTQMEDDLLQSEAILSQHPQADLKPEEKQLTPQEILESLKQNIQEDFPLLPQTDYEVKYVHEDLAEYLSPAFYLTPPIDTLSPNTIYLNPEESLQGISLFTTLAHEGFPGHLYQTIYFASSNPDPIRHLLNFGGYIEGWATYVESYAYDYYDETSASSTLNRLNQSLNLCLLSFLDTAIHYNGWTLSETSSYLDSFGITDANTQKEIFQMIVETPSNYVKYYMGSLHFADLRESMRDLCKENFSLLEFHRAVLTIGPCQFSILEEEVTNYFSSQRIPKKQ